MTQFSATRIHLCPLPCFRDSYATLTVDFSAGARSQLLSGLPSNSISRLAE